MSTKGLVYYTDNTPEDLIFRTCQLQLERCMAVHGFPIISVSHKPLTFGRNIVMALQREALSIFKQILRGLEACETDVVFLVEHDVLYHPSHFTFEPARRDTFYYNRNMWHVSSLDGKAVYYWHNDLSHLCASRRLLLEHYRQQVAYVEKEGFHSSYGFSPPKGLPPEKQTRHYATWMAEVPNVDIRHPRAFTRQRMDRSQFRSERSCRQWTEADEVPWWGRTRDRFPEFMQEVADHDRTI